MASYTIASNVIGLIVRGKENEQHNPSKMAQHADCLLPNGEPVGYFGAGGDGSSGLDSSGSISGSIIPSWGNGPSGSWNQTGINMKGEVYYHADFLQKRPHYVDHVMAKQYNVISTVLLIQTTNTQADLFAKYWKNLSLNPGAFHLLGANCSTNASDAFIAANIVASGIPGLDTPDNLFEQLRSKYTGNVRVFSGHVGASHVSGSNYDLIIE